MKNIEIQSMINAGMPLKYATQAVDVAIAELKSLGITILVRIPWN